MANERPRTLLKRLHFTRTQRSGTGQTFTFPRPNERRLMSVEADQAPTSQKCHEETFRSLHHP
jgi:hypothetical protein